MKKYLLLLSLSLLSSVLFSQPNVGLIACYPFSGNANDASGNGHHGTVLGPVLGPDRFGNPNSAYLFDGIDDFINLGHFANFTSSNSFSISVWEKANQVKLQTLVMINPDNFADRLNAMVYYSHNNQSTTFWDFGNCNIGGRALLMGTTFSNDWEHYVFVTDPVDGMTVYKNGVIQIQQMSSSSLVNRNRDIRIGGAMDAANAQFYFDGYIDDVRFYDRALSPSDVQDLYTLTANCIPTGIAENVNSNDEISLFQNGNELNILFNEDFKCNEINMVNTMGQLIYSNSGFKNAQSFSIDVNGLTTQTLIIRFISDDQIISKKIYLQRN